MCREKGCIALWFKGLGLVGSKDMCRGYVRKSGKESVVIVGNEGINHIGILFLTYQQ